MNAPLVELPLPSAQQARRLLDDVGFDDRLEGIRMTATQHVVVPLFSLKKVAEFLSISDYAPRIGGHIHHIDLNRLQAWVENTLGDAALAREIARQCEAGQCYAGSLALVKPLLQARVAQCAAVLEEQEIPG